MPFLCKGKTCPEQRCGKHFSTLPYLLARAFSPDCNLSQWPHEDRQKVRAAVSSYGTALLKKLGAGDDVGVNLMQELGQWVMRAGPLGLPTDLTADPVAFWNGIALNVPCLARLALAVLTISPSEACVERSFSHQSLIHSDLRARLNQSTIEADEQCA